MLLHKWLIMRKLNKITIQSLRYLFLGLSVFVFTCCEKKLEGLSSEELQIDTNYPDLRYANIKKQYNYVATDASENTFKVKSLYHAWEITGTGPETWCEITPAEGDAGTLYDVVISPKDNTDLDDRVDTLTLSSEGWVGKKFVVFQKGTAYLSASSEEPTLAETVGDRTTIEIESNQDWSAKVADDIDWMEIEGSANANGNGTVTLISIKENGSLRKNGKVYIYDRYDELADSVTIYQNGIFMEFEPLADPLAIEGGTLEVAVSSNTSWTLEIPEEAQEWLSVDKTSGTKSETVTFTIAANSGLSRTVDVLFETNPALIEETLTIDQQGAIPFTEEFFEGNSDVTFNADGSATLTAAPGTGSKKLVSKISNFSYGRYTVNFSDIQIGRNASTMLMCITKKGKINGGISWGAFAKGSYSDSWASEYWLSDAFGSKKRQRFDNDILREDIKSYTIDVKRSATAGMVDVDFYINDQLLKSDKGMDGFAEGEPMILTFWIYNVYDKENTAIFEPSTLLYEPYKY
ncbi:hypothetical protein EYV94_14690 [Puteibacter caeruleilacunae]|nr:hypothetical protein EYV94_14690 [Puteibacter caeruleilacunae]